ncbi:MAG: hypothetical protein A3H59_00055, partial [Candidatus Jacksonbacteria bacterium RIFCSPLOWO2_02_FULL_43_9]
MIILGIESSCDETAAAIVQETNGAIAIVSNIIASQAKIHAQYGGVIPEIAARNHILNIIPVITQAFDAAHISYQNIDGIAVTQGPGLIAALHIGVETAKTLALAWNKPLIPINHMAGHIYSTLKNVDDFQFPVLALLVSGGHTQLVLMKQHYDFEIIGTTIDDAVGEAFDKVAKLLGFPYPGGPAIEQEASEWSNPNIRMHPNLQIIHHRRGVNPVSTDDSPVFVDSDVISRLGLPITFPRPMIDSPDFNFSYSGLKTAVRYLIEKHPDYNRAQVACEFQNAAIDVLVIKTLRAVEHYHIKTLVVGGGVAANQH